MKDIKTILESSIRKDLDKQLNNICNELAEILFNYPDNMQSIINKLLNMICDKISIDDTHDMKKYISEWIKNNKD